MKNKTINILQLIDSLSVGGAERVSINYANAISENKEFKSFLCATRQEGDLKEFINSDVEYLFMNKKSNKDISSYRNLISFIKKNHIDIIHAHSSSYFTACILKVFTGVKIVWHDHYGKSEDMNSRSLKVLKPLSLFFSYIISVNDILKNWAIENLYIKSSKIIYLQNYADLSFSNKEIDLPGTKVKRIVLLANLREQKNHFLALKSFKKLLKSEEKYKNWKLLFVGRDFDDEYSKKIKEFILDNNLENNIFILGTRTDTSDILKNCEIGILSSDSEGLPVALLEYGLSELPVICTNVGQCKEVLNYGEAGILVEKNDEIEFTNALETYINNEELRIKNKINFNKFVNDNYSKSAVLEKVLNIYISILSKREL